MHFWYEILEVSVVFILEPKDLHSGQYFFFYIVIISKAFDIKKWRFCLLSSLLIAYI